MDQPSIKHTFCNSLVEALFVQQMLSIFVTVFVFGILVLLRTRLFRVNPLFTFLTFVFVSIIIKATWIIITLKEIEIRSEIDMTLVHIECCTMEHH